LQYSLTLACHPEGNDVLRSETECSRGTLHLHSKAGGSCSLTSACHPERNDVSPGETECSRGTLRLHSKARLQSNLPCHPERNDVSRSETECSRGTLRLIPNRAAVQSHLGLSSRAQRRLAQRDGVQSRDLAFEFQ